MIDDRELRILRESLEALSGGLGHPSPGAGDLDWERVAAVMRETAERMRDNFPYHHPLYAGQMLKPPHPIARIAYAMAMAINPNNHALDGGRASSAMELECIANIASMFGFEKPLGHLCGGGTMANLEALWVAGRSRPGATILASSQAHYTHRRIGEVLGLHLEEIGTDPRGRMSLDALEARLREGNVGTVVATLGTTGLGAVDPLPGILALRREHGFRVHVDAAYGGYFTLASELAPPARAAFDRIPEVDSIVVDPHKHGLQPYGCGCVLFADPSVSALYQHDSPVTYFSSAALHLGEISLECSRPGASAVALWATQKLLPMERGGAFASGLDRCLRAARALHERLSSGGLFRPLFEPELDIVVYAVEAGRASDASRRASRVFDEAARRGLHLALVNLPAGLVAPGWPGLEMDRDTVTCLRSCLMKPEHLEWIDRIVSVLEESAR